MKFTNLLVVSAASFTVIALTAAVAFSSQFAPHTAEIQIAIVMVTAVAVILAILFATALGLSRVGLTDSGQALGLPEGSVRALIALFLIVLFVIVSIFLFRQVAFPVAGGTVSGLSKDEVLTLQNAGQLADARSDPIDATLYQVVLQQKPSSDGVAMAQQVMTTVGTLVVAVAGFYFGAKSAGTAPATVPQTPENEATATQREQAQAAPAAGVV